MLPVVVQVKLNFVLNTDSNITSIIIIVQSVFNKNLDSYFSLETGEELRHKICPLCTKFQV